jgi:hypothetical protein
MVLVSGNFKYSLVSMVMVYICKVKEEVFVACLMPIRKGLLPHSGVFPGWVGGGGWRGRGGGGGC